MSDISIFLRRFKRSNDTKLELPSKSIQYIPQEIYGFTQLEVLDLSKNLISSVDAKISQLSNLKVLDLSGNNLMMLPEAILSIPNLQVLNVENNPLSSKFEILKRPENQAQPRLTQALQVAFGLADSLEECKEGENMQMQSHQNQGNLVKDIVSKDQEISQLKEQNQKLQNQLSRLSLSNKSSSQGGLQIDSNTQTVLEVDINEIRIGRQISQGGFSTVHEGSFRGCPVAVKKIFNPNINQELLDELNNEINMFASLRHPQIVLLMAIVSRPPNLCIVTDYLPRGDLHTLLHRKKSEKLSREQKINIVQQIADVFVFVHANKIVHRDLKSLNILLDQNLQIKLCDFGLARRFEDLNTGTSRFSGTPTYMALELYQKKSYNHKVDVFAFGTLLWETFAREIPFGGLEPMEIMDKVQKDDPLPQSFDVPNNVSSLVQRCRAKQPEKRPEFTEIAEEIRSWSKF